MIRKGRIGDAEEIANIKIENWRKTYLNIFTDEYLNNLNLDKEVEKYKDNFENRNIIIYEKNKNVIAYSYYGKRNAMNLKEYTGEVFALYVKDDCQGRGVGTALLQEAIRDLSKTNKKIILWCAKENYRAIKFYEKNGLKMLGKATENIGGKDVEKVALGLDLEKEKVYNLKKSANYIENEENLAIYTNPDLIFLKGETKNWFKEIIEHKKDSNIPQKFVEYLLNKDAIEQS